MKRTSKFNDLQNMVNYLGNLEDKADNASDIITKGMDHKIHPSNNLPKNLSDNVHKALEVHGIAILSSLTEITSSAIANSVSEYAVSRVDNLRAKADQISVFETGGLFGKIRNAIFGTKTIPNIEDGNGF